MWCSHLTLSDTENSPHNEGAKVYEWSAQRSSVWGGGTFGETVLECKGHGSGYRLNCVSYPQFIHSSPNSSFSMWPYFALKVVFLHKTLHFQVKMRSLEWALIQYDWCPHKKEELGHRHAHRENVRWKWRLGPGWCIHQPKITSKPPECRRGAGRDSPSRPHKEPTLPTPRSQLRPQNWKTINLCCLGHPVCDTVLWQCQPANTRWNQAARRSSI